MIERRRIAVVTPWFGPDLRGGAEQQAWQLATRLARRDHAVDVLTTCCRSFFDDWGTNHHPEGSVTANGLTVRRFPVSRRDRESFDGLNAELLAITPEGLRPGVPPVSGDRARIWSRENINSRALQEYLGVRPLDYDDIVFLPYLYGTTINGLPLVADRAWLQPCLHDEVYAYLPDIESTFLAAKGLLFNSDGEARLAALLYGPATLAKGMTVGEGVEFEGLERDTSPELPAGVRGKRYVLCLGRRDTGKGIDRLVDAFAMFRERYSASELQLVLAGPGEMDYGGRDAAILDLGLVSNEAKAALLHGCRALCQPSINESFSRALFEAWYCGKPVIVNRRCLATSIAVEKCGGGWLAGPVDEWVESFAAIDAADASHLLDIGSRGRRHAQDVADWESVIWRYEDAFRGRSLSEGPRFASAASPAIHQLLPNLSFGDAISNEALFIRNELRALGFASHIFARHIDPRVHGECVPFTSLRLNGTDALIYHHSIGSDVTSFAAEYAGPKCLVYHNITPPQFFASFRPEFAGLLRDGREQMWSLARAFPVSVGDSEYNAAELAIFGFRTPGVLPLAVDPALWAQRPDPALMSRLQDGVRNLLFVGRVAPNKCQHELVEAFCHYRDLEEARLILVGSYGSQDPYSNYLRERIDELGLEAHVWLAGQSSTAELHAYYRTAHLFWSMSEHEGFCAPVIEAMWFDVPVFAFRSTAVPETLGDAGSMFESKRDLSTLARTAMQLSADSDNDVRQRILGRQQVRRQAYLPSAVRSALYRLIESLVAGDKVARLTTRMEMVEAAT